MSHIRARPLQPGRYYHIYLPSAHSRELFSSKEQYELFLALYAGLIQSVADTYAYCLLPNHFHFLIKTLTVETQIKRWYESPTSNREFAPFSADQQFATLFARYAALTLCAEPLLACPVERIPIRDEANLPVLTRYIHYNPQTHSAISLFRLWHWSSYRTLMSRKPTLLSAETTLSWFYSEEWFDEMHWLPVDESEIGYLILKD